MRHVILLDNKIADSDFEQWNIEDRGFWKTNIGITPEYKVIRTDFSDYPTYVDSDNDIRPTDAYLQSLADQVKTKYGPLGADFIMVMIHEDNWKSDTPHTRGIWGTNYSYAFGNVCLEYSRWDRSKLANTFGTAYHERHHSFDAILKVELGIHIKDKLGVEKYDHGITHGHEDPWEYIRHKENTQSLKVMAPYLQRAFAERREAYLTERRATLATLALKAVKKLLRMWWYKTNGVPRG